MSNKETLEEAAERNYNEAGVNAYFNNGFIRGSKWQQEQDKNKFSEEEVLEQLNHLMTIPSSKLDEFTDDNGNITMKWFEQFKKQDNEQ
jgi:hypothetical protein